MAAVAPAAAMAARMPSQGLTVAALTINPVTAPTSIIPSHAKIQHAGFFRDQLA